MNEVKKMNKGINQSETIDYKIANVVATVSFKLDEKIDLLKILTEIKDTEYNPEVFPGLVMRIKNPKATFLIFPSGKMILTGLRDIPYAEFAVNKLMKKFKRANIILTNPDIKITNIVASVDFHSFINLNKGVIRLDNVMYEPEVFPALIYHMQEPRAVFLIFSTGKIVCTKIRNKIDLVRAINKLKEQLESLKIMSDEFEPEQKEEIIFF